MDTYLFKWTKRVRESGAGSSLGHVPSTDGSLHPPRRCRLGLIKSLFLPLPGDDYTLRENVTRILLEEYVAGAIIRCVYLHTTSIDILEHSLAWGGRMAG